MGAFAIADEFVVTPLVRAALESRHDQASGTLMTRPSVRLAVMRLSVTSMLVIRGSLPAAVFIPSLIDESQIVKDELADSIQLLSAKPIVRRQHDRIEPELTRLSLPLGVNMPRFLAVEAVEEESIRADDPLNCWHGIGSCQRNQSTHRILY